MLACLPPFAGDKSAAEIQALRAEGRLQAPTVTMVDFSVALSNTNPSVAPSETERFEKWDQEFGSH